MILGSKLENLKQGTLSLNNHLIKFHEAVHSFRLASGKNSEEDLGCKILMSLSDFKEARDISNLELSPTLLSLLNFERE